VFLKSFECCAAFLPRPVKASSREKLIGAFDKHLFPLLKARLRIFQARLVQALSGNDSMRSGLAVFCASG
jgi:hypothetical protein